MFCHVELKKTGRFGELGALHGAVLTFLNEPRAMENRLALLRCLDDVVSMDVQEAYAEVGSLKDVCYTLHTHVDPTAPCRSALPGAGRRRRTAGDGLRPRCARRPCTWRPGSRRWLCAG